MRIRIKSPITKSYYIQFGDTDKDGHMPVNITDFNTYSAFIWFDKDGAKKIIKHLVEQFHINIIE